MRRAVPATTLFAALLAVGFGCAPITTPPAETVPANTNAINPNQPSLAPLGDPQFPAPRAVPSRAGEIKGVVYGPKAGLIAQKAQQVKNAPTSDLVLLPPTGLVVLPPTGATSPAPNGNNLVLLPPTGYHTLAAASAFEEIGNASVEILDETGKVLTEKPATTNADGSFSVSGFLGGGKLLFVRVTYQDAEQPVTLLAPATSPGKAEVEEVKVDPGMTLVSKKLSEMLKRKAATTDEIDPALATQLATQVIPYMNDKSLAAAVMLSDAKGAEAFDAMLLQAPALKAKLAEVVGAQGAKLIAPTPILKTILAGTVYDENGEPVDGAKVTIKSLAPTTPYEKTVDTQNGTYSVDDAPADVQLELTATKTGWTSRSRTEVINADGASGVDFGGVTDLKGAVYFLSNHPEIVKTEPSDDQALADASSLVYKLTLSEPLDEANQTRFAEALRVFPANSVADTNPDDALIASDMVDLATVEVTEDKLAYVVKKDSTFLGNAATKATVTWDADGKVATFTFPAPLIAGDKAEALYNIALVNTGNAIKDTEGNRLGTDPAGSFSAQPALNGIWCGTFKDGFMSLGTAATAEEKWLRTHHVAGAFKVPSDTTKPVLTDFSVIEDTNYTRLLLTFNEPMSAYAGGSVGLSNVIMPDEKINTMLSYFTFAVAETQGKVDAVELDGSGVTGIKVDDANFTGTTNLEKEFKFVAELLGQVQVTLDPDNPKVLRIDLREKDNSAFRFPASLTAIKVRTSIDIMDPAGNRAEATSKIGTL